jgi:hypothetical protein
LLSDPTDRQTKAATTTFDGNWWVTVDYHEYKNPDGSTALAAVKHFSVKVKNGVLHGEIGTRGAADWYELNGTIAADGAAPSFRPPQWRVQSGNGFARLRPEVLIENKIDSTFLQETGLRF